MKAFLLAVVAVIAIGIGAATVLERFQTTVDTSFVGSGARPDADPKLHSPKS